MKFRKIPSQRPGTHRDPGDDLTHDCHHRRDEDCQNCLGCGRCREDVDENDVCAECRKSLLRKSHTPRAKKKRKDSAAEIQYGEKMVTMNVDEIVQQLKRERDKLTAAINALQSSPSGSTPIPAKRRGRPPLSAQAKRKMSEIMRANWAKRKKAANMTGGKQAPKKTARATGKKASRNTSAE